MTPAYALATRNENGMHIDHVHPVFRARDPALEARPTRDPKRKRAPEGTRSHRPDGFYEKKPSLRASRCP